MVALKGPSGCRFGTTHPLLPNIVTAQIEGAAADSGRVAGWAERRACGISSVAAGRISRFATNFT
jgi:hypothetical protein